LAHPFLARLLLTALAATHGLAALKIDLNRSHATNPLWTGHARFHLVWQVLNLALAGLVEVGLIWWFGPGAAARFYVAACLVAITLVAFWGALASMRLYGGALYDPNGILPARVRMGGRVLHLDMNTVAVTLGSLVLLISVAIYG
jgi:hypothetical protein